MLVDPETGRPRKFAYAPGLVVVDGGPPQVAAASGRSTSSASTTSRSAGWPSGWRRCGCPDEEDPVILPRSSEGLYLLQRVRDEAHRFAITHHRSRRSKSMVESLLDDVPGLGEVRRKTLLKHFGSLKKLRAARVDEIAAVPGIGPRTAAAIKEAVTAARRRPARLSPVNTATGEILDDSDEPARATDRRAPADGRPGRGHRDDRRRPQHRGQGARGPRLLRRRQPAAAACCPTWSGSSTRATAASRRSRSSSTCASGLVLRRRCTRSCAQGGDRRRHAPWCSSTRPTTCWSAGRRRPAGRTRCRAAAGCSTG